MVDPNQSLLDAFLNPGVKTLVDSIPAAIFVKDRSSRIILINSTCEKHWGLTLTSLYGTDGSQFFPPEQMELFLANDRAVFDNRIAIDVEETFWNNSLKQNRIGHTFKRAIFDEDGEPIGLVGVTIDITERVEIEANLHANNLKLHSLYELAPMGIALTDMQGHYIEFNHAFEQICGYTQEELNKLDYWALTPSEYRNQEMEQLDSLRKYGKYGPYEKEYIRKDGSRIPLQLRGVMIQCGDGNSYVWSIVEDITDRKKKDALIWQQANFDIVTGLPNRRLFLDRLEVEIKKAKRTISQIAILFIDLDHFKEVNDTYGHKCGDELLAEAAQRIRSCVRETDTVSRAGGDEFAVMLTEFGGLSNVERIAKNIVESLHAPFDFGGESGNISASIGITFYPNDASDIETLLIHADQAMYLAKSQGRDRYVYFTESMQRKIDEKRILTHDLKSALEQNELQVFYQPIVDSVSGDIVKAEALLRWIHPKRGMIGPIEFITLAEESGLIFDIGDWVFSEACQAVQRWHARFGRILEISVNLSPVQFSDSARSDRWLNTLKSLPLKGIAVEITEGMLLKDTSKVKQRLLELRNHGVQVSIDDFGTGFSALSYLKKFDIDYLKIDRAFTNGLIDDSSDRALTEAIIVMAHKLGIKTIAEGVETEAQRDILVELGSDFLQGYLFSRPLPQDQFETLLEKGQHRG